MSAAVQPPRGFLCPRGRAHPDEPERPPNAFELFVREREEERGAKEEGTGGEAKEGTGGEAKEDKEREKEKEEKEKGKKEKEEKEKEKKEKKRDAVAIRSAAWEAWAKAAAEVKRPFIDRARALKAEYRTAMTQRRQERAMARRGLYGPDALRGTYRHEDQKLMVPALGAPDGVRKALRYILSFSVAQRALKDRVAAELKVANAQLDATVRARAMCFRVSHFLTIFFSSWEASRT